MPLHSHEISTKTTRRPNALQEQHGATSTIIAAQQHPRAIQSTTTVVYAVVFVQTMRFPMQHATPATKAHPIQQTGARPWRATAQRLQFAAIAGLVCCATLGSPAWAKNDTIGTVSTAFQWLGRNHDIIVEAYDDPVVQGVTCYVSRARTGGIKGSLGLAEDRSEASISCHQVAPIRITEAIPKQEQVFSERISLLFKRLRVVRMVDMERHSLVYLTYSDKLIDGSPQNSITAVPIGLDTPIQIK